jgi:lactoylglutathione lyase
MITELFPILSTPDLDRALGFYRDLLGGTVSYSFPSPDGATVYVGLNVGSSHIGIALEAAVVDAPRPRPINLWVYADDCDAVVERVRASGGTITEEAADQPWGERVARVLDPDGNDLIIGQRASGPSASEPD